MAMTPYLEKFIRTHYKDMSGYVSAGMAADKNKEIVFMNANESHFSLPALQGYNFYPEPQPQKLLKLMAQAYGVEPSHIAATRGADEGITLLTKLFCEPHEDAILINSPAFGMYAVNATASPVKIHNVPLLRVGNSFALDKAAIITAAQNPDNHIKMVYLCSPNNPTGGAFPPADLLEIIKALKGHCVVVLDEAYAEFLPEGGLTHLLKDHPHLIILRTLSKAYGLAGVRMGAVLCHDPDFIQVLVSKVMDAYPLPRPSIEAALIALAPENAQAAKDNMAKALAERDRLRDFFKTVPFVTKIYDSAANFLMIEIQEGNASAVVKYCANHGFLIRDFSTKSETANCIRIAPALPEQNDKFMEVFAAFKPA